MIVGVLCATVFAYGYFVQLTISYIIERKHAEDKISILYSEISEFELLLSTYKNQLDFQYGETLGLKEVKNIVYAERTRLVQNE